MLNEIKYFTVETDPKSNIKSVEEDKFDTLNTEINGHLLSWLGTGISIKNGRVKLIVWAQIFHIDKSLINCSHRQITD
jgi:hypothetical protein